MLNPNCLDRKKICQTICEVLPNYKTTPSEVKIFVKFLHKNQQLCLKYKTSMVKYTTSMVKYKASMVKYNASISKYTISMALLKISYAAKKTKNHQKCKDKFRM